MGTITIRDGGQEISCSIQRGKRVRTMALRVAMDGHVTIMLPQTLSMDTAQHFVERKASWIRKQQNMRLRMREKYPPKELVSGETISVFGRPYRLRIAGKARQPACEIRHKRLVINARPSTPARIKAQLTQFLKGITIQQAQESAQRYAPQLGVQVRRIYAANQAKRWGSCSRKGDVRINWKLAMAPLAVFNYVVAHEVCHLKCGNHSRQFWNTLRSLMPQYEKNRTWLKENSGLVASL